MKYDPKEFGLVFEEQFFEALLKGMKELGESNQKALAEKAFGVADAGRKWHRIKATHKKQKRQRIWLADAAALVVAMGHDLPGFFLLVHQATKDHLTPRDQGKKLANNF